MAIKTSKYKIYFSHVELPTDTINDQFGTNIWPEGKRRCTIAKLFSSESNLELNEYISICNPSDNFCKADGRKIALEGVLDSVVINKQERKEIWKEYFRFLGGINEYQTNNYRYKRKRRMLN